MVMWSSGLCDCFSDCCSCWTVICAPCVALGQLSQKVLGYSCVVVTMFLLCAYALAYSFELYADLPHEDNWYNRVACVVEYHGFDDYDMCFPHPFVIAFCFIAFCASCIFTTLLRNAIRRRDKIEQRNCKDCRGIKDGEDCCCAIWCGPCSICQMMRHEGLTGSSYSIMAQTGLAAAPDNIADVVV